MLLETPRPSEIHKFPALAELLCGEIFVSKPTLRRLRDVPGTGFAAGSRCTPEPGATPTRTASTSCPWTASGARDHNVGSRFPPRPRHVRQ